jgi:histidinol-phosphatase (PHP family)
MHTPLCGHATGEPAEYAARAVALGLTEIGFSDHSPLIAHERANISMRLSELPVYHKMIRGVQQAYYGRLNIKLGIEADYVPGHEKVTGEILAGFPYDYVIGSVHFMKDWGFDNPEEIKQWETADVARVYRDYYALLRQSAESGLFDIIGHVDLVKKFGHRSPEDQAPEVRKTAETFKDSGVVIEINTAGLRKPVGEIYPSLEALKIYREFRVPVTFGSDAHQPDDVGRDFAAAARLARDAGYEEYVSFRNRSIEDVLPLPR